MFFEFIGGAAIFLGMLLLSRGSLRTSLGGLAALSIGGLIVLFKYGVIFN